jgi:hypothetical protein
MYWLSGSSNEGYERLDGTSRQDGHDPGQSNVPIIVMDIPMSFFGLLRFFLRRIGSRVVIG